MKKYAILLPAALAYATCMNAQGIKGRVMENDSTPVPYATVALLQASDSSYVTGTIGDLDGAFAFQTDPDNKIIRVSYVGYETVFLPAAGNMTVTLPPAAQSLREVTVTAVRPTFKMEKGVFVTNIQGTAFSKLGRAEDVLQQLPLMSADGISVLGRGTPLIYINNKLMRDNSELERLSSDMIKDIKIDMNPGAKHGNARAVLYITTTKPVGEGLGGSVYLRENMADGGSIAGWLNLNYRKKGLDIFSNSGYQRTYNWKGTMYDIYDFKHNGQDLNVEYAGDYNTSSKYGYTSIGFNNQFGEKQSIGAIYTFTRTPSNHYEQEMHNTVRLGDACTEFRTHSKNFSQNSNHKVSVYYENQLSDRLALNVDGVYTHHNNYQKQTVTDRQADNETTLTPVNKAESDMGALKTVLSSSIGEGKLEYGFEGTYTRFHQNYYVENQDYSGVLTTNDNESRQKAANVFVEYSRSFGKFYTRIGMKYEYADYEYFVQGQLMEDNSRTYHRILPSLSLSYSMDRLSLMLSYDIHTQNPTYSQLDDALKYINDFRYYKGNSLLKPTYSHGVSLSASYKDFLLTCNYSYKKDGFVTWFKVMEQNPVILAGENNQDFSSLNSSISYSPTFFKIWKPSWSLWMYKQWLSYGGMSYSRPQIGLQWKNHITLPKNWVVTLNAIGNLKGNSDTYMGKAFLRTNITLLKNWKNFRARLSASNIFNSKERGYTLCNGIYYLHEMDYHRPTISLTLSYSFNPAKSKYKGKSAGESELRRL